MLFIYSLWIRILLIVLAPCIILFIAFNLIIGFMGSLVWITLLLGTIIDIHNLPQKD